MSRIGKQPITVPAGVAVTIDEQRVVVKGPKGTLEHEVPATILGKLPLEFKTLGFSVHDAFDRLGLDAKDLRDPKHSLEQLSAILGRCAGCHAAYQLKATGP